MRLAFAALFMVVACSDGRPSSPRIDELAPPQATAGQVVNILGLAFCGQDPKDLNSDGSCATTLDAFVTFGGQPGVLRNDAKITRWDDTRIDVTLPSGVIGATTVVVTVGGRPSNQVSLQVQ